MKLEQIWWSVTFLGGTPLPSMTALTQKECKSLLKKKTKLDWKVNKRSFCLVKLSVSVIGVKP